MASFPQASPPTPCAHLYPPPNAPHALAISFVSILPPAQYWVKGTDHSAPRYAAFSMYNELTTSNPLSITKTRYYTTISCFLLPFVVIDLRVFEVISTESSKIESIQGFCCYNYGSCCFKLEQIYNTITVEATLPWLPSNHRLTTTTVGRIY